MKIFGTVALLAFATTFAVASGRGESQRVQAERDGSAGPDSRCSPAGANEPRLYSDDFRWNYDLDEMKERFEEIYLSGRRLPHRAEHDAINGGFRLPYAADRGGPVRLSQRLIDSVRRHIEVALKRGYVDAVFFPDMGHAHLFIPSRVWEQEYRAIPIARTSDLYARLFDDERLKILYHTAEQLRTLDENGSMIGDRRVSWRFHTRNLIGDNKGLGQLEIHQNVSSRANTLGELEGHFYYGAGFQISASRDGCFEYTDRDGRLRRFDISLSDLEPRPSAPSAGGGDWR